MVKPKVHKALDPIPESCKWGIVAHAVILALRRQMWENQEFKVVLGSIVSSRLARTM